MDLSLSRQSGNSSGSTASKSDDASSVRIVPAHGASNSGKASSCRSDERKKIKDQIISTSPSNLKVVPMVGMGGIGKTTLAKSIYEDIEISYHFHLRAWITVSQEYKLRNVLLGLLSSMDSLPDKVSQLGNEDLTQVLYRRLKGRRFLIVLDDMWNVQTWNDLKLIFPNDDNGSRVMLTSRLMEVAECTEQDSPPHFMNCLSNEESWRLLQNEVFFGKPCPSDLVKIGQEIAKKCQGLPLAIVVVAGQLSNIDKNQDYWADVAKSLDSLITGNQEQILDVLCLSYNYLSQRLKACFLYMGIFPKNSEIHVLKLTRFWSAVGFLHSEVEAEKCLQDLINRNLIMVRKKKFDGTAKTCGIHDLLWDLSLRETRKEGHHIFGQSNFRHSHFNAATDDMKYLMDLTSTYRYLGDSFETDFPLSSICLRLLKVLDIESESFYLFPKTITNLDSLTYLELSTFYIPESVSRLCNLETLINRHSSVLPEKIWLLRRLRHLQVGSNTFFPSPSCASIDGRYVSSMDGSFVSICLELQTLSTISFITCTEQVFSRIPNLKRLKISDINGAEDENLFNFFNNLVYLHRLEKLNLYFKTRVTRQQQIPWCDSFPPSLKQLTLFGSRLQWEDMNILAMLPNIEVLKLKWNAFGGPIYEQTVEGFPRLKFLLFEDLDLEEWIADTIHYPVLQHLVLRHCYFLKGIPYCFGEIPTLESIEMVGLSRFCEESAETIQQEQQNMGNYVLQVRRVHVRFSWVPTEGYPLRRRKNPCSSITYPPPSPPPLLFLPSHSVLFRRRDVSGGRGS